MNNRAWVVPVIVLGVLLLCVALFLATFERKLVEDYTPPHGEAVSNPLFALQRTLNLLGQPAFSTTRLPPLQGRRIGTLVLAADVERLDDTEARTLLQWVGHGGHLLVRVAHPAAAAHAPLFAQSQLLVARTGERACQAIHVEDGTPDLSYCGLRFILDGEHTVDAAIGDPQQGYLFARIRYDEGWISLLSNTAPLTGDGLRGDADRGFVRGLLAPRFGQGTTVLIHALDGPSFLVRLITEGWSALLALLLALIGWALMRGERLGPLIPAPPLQRRALLEHVQAVGEFLYRRDSGRSLHRLACDTAMARLRRRDPLCAALEGEALYQRLAERHRLDPAQVARAFHPPANALAFRDSVAILARLRNRP